MSLVVWCNQPMPEASLIKLESALKAHALVYRPGATQGDPDLERADVAYGQPPPDGLLRCTRLRFVQISSAGYSPYDRQDLRRHLAALGATMAKSSVVFDEPCAEHVLAFMTAWARQLPSAHAAQRADHSWSTASTRTRSTLLMGQTVVLYGFGSIARRIVELLAPLHMNVVGIRRNPQGDEPVPIVSLGSESVTTHLGRADHVVNILPGGADTHRHFDSQRLAAIKPGAVFYNIGRGTTVDQDALAELLRSGHLAAAFLDVTDPEPLPREHALWSAPNCFITPHTGGGHAGEEDRLIDHFGANLARIETGKPPVDRVY